MLFGPLTLLLAAAPPEAPDPFAYDVVDVAPGVQAFVERKLNAIVSGTVVAITGRDAVLVFDTGHHPRTARRIVAELKERTDRPVRWVVVSHWHDDHWVGNAEFADAWPGLQVIAHPFTAKIMKDRQETFRGERCRTDLANDSRPLREQLASGKRPNGDPIPEASMTRLRDFVAAADEQAAQCEEMRYRGVDRTIDREETFDLGGRTVRLMFLGRGNTAGDLVAYLPEDRVLLTGDLVVRPFPFATQSYVTEWAAVLRRIGGMDLTAIVPGHGAVTRDGRYVADVAEILESISRQGKAAWHAGMTVDELKAKIDLSALAERFAHGDAFIRLNLDYMMGLAMDRMWQELSGQWKPEGDG
ncbi:MAG: MBL fold metallo-hydrolase [Gemmatimonadales bacterium]